MFLFCSGRLDSSRNQISRRAHLRQSVSTLKAGLFGGIDEEVDALVIGSGVSTLIELIER